MKVSLIVAMASNRVIGINNQMPWHLSADLKHFKKITMGKPLLMGRKTFESIGKPLPGRRNNIISRNVNYQQPGCFVYNSIESALQACQDEFDEIMIIGGASFYEAMLPKATCIYLTQIGQNFDGDTLFPEIDLKQWNEIERLDINDDSSVNFKYSFITLQRI